MLHLLITTQRFTRELINSTREAGMHLSNLLVKIFQQNIVSYLNDIRNVRPCIEVKCKKSESIGNTGKGNTVINHNKFKT